jgi:hypothetical protein
MKKYKHIKRGCIAELAGHKIDYNITLNGEIAGTLPKWVIEDSADWFEVKDAYPKIVAVKNKYVGHIIWFDGETPIKRDDNLSLTTTSSLQICLENGVIIYQVAVSEDVVFTIGDKVTWPHNNLDVLPFCTISEFVFEDEKLKIVYTELPKSRHGFYPDLHHYVVKTPLFVTEDGKEIFEGNEFFRVFLKNLELYESKTIATKEYNFKFMSNCAKHFSTKQLAEKYIEQNKPKFSIKDVEDALECKEDYMVKNMGIYAPVNMVKQKLGI